MKNLLFITLIFIASCNNTSEPEAKSAPMSFAGALPAASKVLSESSYTYKIKDTTVTGKITVTQSESKSWPDAPTIPPGPVDTIKPPPVTPPTSTNPAGWNPPANTRMKTGFEAGLTDGWNKYIQQPYTSPAYVTKSTEQKSEGSYSAKFYMTSDAAQATGESHAQLTKIDLEYLKEGDERWYDNDYFLAAPYTTDLQFIRQWHHAYSSYSPPAALCTYGGKLSWDYITVFQNSDKFSDLGIAPIGKWFNVKIHMIFSSVEGKALTEVWIDNVKKLTARWPNKFAAYDNIEMIGLYHWQWKGTNYAKGLSSTIYIDNYKLW